MYSINIFDFLNMIFVTLKKENPPASDYGRLGVFAVFLIYGSPEYQISAGVVMQILSS